MGNHNISNFLFSSSASSSQISWSSDFHLLDKDSLNNTYVLHHLPTATSFKVKHLTLNKQQNSELFQLIHLRHHNPSPFVVRLQKIQQYTVKNYCSEHQEVFIMFEHVQNTIKEEILNRRFNKQQFTLAEIKVLLQTGVKGLAYLNELGCPPKALNCSEILITPQRSLLINDPLISTGSLFSETSPRTVNSIKPAIFSIPQQDYPSPQKLLFHNDLIDEYSEWLSSLFTFGVIVLEAIFLEPLVDTLYDKGQKKIYYHKVKQKIQQINDFLEPSSTANSQPISMPDSYQNPNLSSPITFLEQIKQDLRRLLSHEPKIRQSVYLKYKKSNPSKIYLKNSNSFSYKDPSKKQLVNALNPNANSINSLFFNPSAQVDNELESLFKKYSQISNYQMSNSPNYNPGQNDVKESKPSNNKFRVVSSSLPTKLIASNRITPSNGNDLKGPLQLGKGGSEKWAKTQQNHGVWPNVAYQTSSKPLEYQAVTAINKNPYQGINIGQAGSDRQLPNSKQEFLSKHQPNTLSHIFPTSTVSSSQISHAYQPVKFNLDKFHHANNTSISHSTLFTTSTSQYNANFNQTHLPKTSLNATSYPSSKFAPFSDSFKPYFTNPLPSTYQPSDPQPFIDFQSWKKTHFPSTNSNQSKPNNPAETQLISAKLPSSKQLSHFPYKEVGSINCDQSHFFNDKQSFVIESYATAFTKPIPQRVQTPISTLHSSNVPNLSPKNSLEINHSHIHLRNEPKSFSSMDEDLKELRKVGFNRDFNDKNMNEKNLNEKKPYSSYSSSQKVSLIDKIYDPQLMSSQEGNSPNKFSLNNCNFEHFNGGPSMNNSKPSGNFSEQYLQTPERYPGRQKLNSTIREASCEDSGVNHSNENNESYSNQKVYPQTEVSKYNLMEEGRLSERKFEPKCLKQQQPFQQPTTQQKSHLYQQQKSNACNMQQLGSNVQNRVTLYADGSRYIGQTDDQGQSHGYGTLYYPDSQIAYQGYWVYGDFNGSGKLVNPYQVPMSLAYDYNDLSGVDEHLKQFEGQFKQDLKEGSGVLTLQNDQVFEGEFCQDIAHGKGKFYCSNSSVVQGIWQRGILKTLIHTSTESCITSHASRVMHHES